MDHQGIFYCQRRDTTQVKVFFLPADKYLIDIFRNTSSIVKTGYNYPANIEYPDYQKSIAVNDRRIKLLLIFPIQNYFEPACSGYNLKQCFSYFQKVQMPVTTSAKFYLRKDQQVLFIYAVCCISLQYDLVRPVKSFV